jgi:hypothetical protein
MDSTLSPLIVMCPKCGWCEPATIAIEKKMYRIGTPRIRDGELEEPPVCVECGEDCLTYCEKDWNPTLPLPHWSTEQWKARLEKRADRMLWRWLKSKWMELLSILIMLWMLWEAAR